jgi:hypothetical protein
MQAHTKKLLRLEALQQQLLPVIECKENLINMKKAAHRRVIIKVKRFFGNLSPLHWYDEFKDIKIDMNEFAAKKTNIDNKA